MTCQERKFHKANTHFLTSTKEDGDEFSFKYWFRCEDCNERIEAKPGVPATGVVEFPI